MVPTQLQDMHREELGRGWGGGGGAYTVVNRDGNAPQLLLVTVLLTD